MTRRSRTTQLFICLSFLLGLLGGCGDGEPKKVIRFVEAVEDFTQVSASQLDFGRREETLVVVLSNNSHETARWVASADASWITVEPDRGRFEPWSEKLIRITVERSKLTKSEGSGLVTIEIPTYEERKQIWVSVLK